MRTGIEKYKIIKKQCYTLPTKREKKREGNKKSTATIQLL
jgi:hypothetical protein